MFNSWNLGTISGIKIRIHWTFLLLPAWIYFSSIMAGSGTVAAGLSVLFVLAIFGCVLLHELGHALAARQFGIGTRDITLLPIGGVAALERMPRNPFQELWIAVAGPLVNVVIAAVLFVGLAAMPAMINSPAGHFLGRLMLANVILVVFNMIPAFPMDGGRVLRSLLAMFMDYVRATQIAATVGQFSAIGLGLLGLVSGNIMLILVASFVYLAARSENYQVASSQSRPNQYRQPFAQQFPQHFSQTKHSGYKDFQDGFQNDAQNGFRNDAQNGSRNVAPSDSAAEVAFFDESVPASLSVSSVAAWLASQHRDYCDVVEAGRIIGNISRPQLVAAIYRGLGRVPVGQLLAT